MTQPNILLITADDHRHDAIGAAGAPTTDPTVQTPVLDGLIANGVHFRRNHHMGGMSGAVCVPTRACLHTGAGVFHAMTGNDDRSRTLDPALPTLGETLQQHGYHTFASGKWHNDKASFARSFSDGANLFFGGMSDHDAVPLHDFDPSGEYPDAARYTGDGFSTELFTDAAVNFLNTRGQNQNDEGDEQPFFLYLAYTAPHDPRTPPPDYAALYNADEIELPPNFLPAHPFDNGELHNRDEDLAGFPRTEAEIRQHIADYYGMISHMDAAIGRVLAALADNGLAENTVVVYTADHGLAVGRHGLLGKQNLYDHSIRVPLILHAPTLPSGQTVETLTYTFDLYPTLCELADVPAPETVESRSLLRLIEGEVDHARETVCTVYKRIMRSISDGEWKLIRYYRDFPARAATALGTNTYSSFTWQTTRGRCTIWQISLNNSRVSSRCWSSWRRGCAASTIRWRLDSAVKLLMVL